MLVGFLLLFASCASADVVEGLQKACDTSCQVRTELFCDGAPALHTTSSMHAPHVEGHHRRLFDPTSVLGQWKVFEALSNSFAQFKDYIMEGLQLLSNLMFVVLMGFGFAFLPRKLMLIVALVGVFGPMFFTWVSVALFHGSANTFVDIGPFIVETFLGLIVLCFTVAMTNPGLAVLVMWLFAFMSSQVFQWALQKMGLDLNDDGKVGWRDLLVAIIQALKNRCGDNWIYAFALDELYDSASKTLRAVKQNEEILERQERLEAMLILIGRVHNLDLDLREAQRRDLNGLIDNTSVNMNATVKVQGPRDTKELDLDHTNVLDQFRSPSRPATGGANSYQKLEDGRAVKEETTAGPASGAAKIMSA